MLNSPVKVSSVEIDWLYRLVLKDIILDDPDGNNILEADHVFAGFKILPLFEKKIIFTTIRLFGFSLKLKKKSPEDALNIQFLIDALSSKDSTSNPAIELQIESILVRRGKLNYHIENKPFLKDKFDPNHINIKNLNARIILNHFYKDSLNAFIQKLSFEEQSGFLLDKFTTTIIGNSDSLSLQKTEIHLSNSLLQIPDAVFFPNKIDSLAQPFIESTFMLNISPSHIFSHDISPFIPFFNKISETVYLSAKASGTLNDFSLYDLSFKQNDNLSISGRVDLKNITKPNETYLFGKINSHFSANGLRLISNNIENTDSTQFYFLEKLGNLNFNGEISGFIDQLVAYGNLNSDIGSIKLDLLVGQQKMKGIDFYIKGEMSSTDLYINQVFKEGNPYGNMQFNILIDAARPINGDFSGSIKAQINHFDYKFYRYENLIISGDFNKNEFTGFLNIDDPNGKLSAEGLFRNNGINSAFILSAELKGLKPGQLGITPKYEDSELNLLIKANITGNNLDFFNGYVSIDNLSFLTKTDSFYLDRFILDAKANGIKKEITLTSDLINGNISGEYEYKSLFQSIVNINKSYLPSLTNSIIIEKDLKENSIHLNLAIENTERLSNALKLPFTVVDKGSIIGEYDSKSQEFYFETLLPKIKIGTSIIDSNRIICKNKHDNIILEITANHLHKNGSYNYLNLKANAKNDKIISDFRFSNNRDKGTKINLSTTTRFFRENVNKRQSNLQTEIEIHPGEIMIKDSTWIMDPSTILFNDGNLSISNFSLAKENQFIRINGVSSSKDPKKSILLDLKDIELSFIFDVINNPGLQFGGRATGLMRFSDLYENRIINTDIEVQNFSFNQIVQGRLNLFSEWDNVQEGILLLGTIYKNDSIWTDVNGYIYPIGEKKGLSLYFEANDIDIALLHPYVKAFTKTIEGRGYGNFHLFGPFNALTFEGNTYIKDGRIGVDYLNTYYTFSDSIKIQQTSILGENIIIYDKFNNKGLINFEIKHKHLKNFTFQSNIQADNLLFFDVANVNKPNIYGTVFGSGNAKIQASSQLVFIDANLRNEPKTKVGFNFMNSGTTEDYDFIIFKEKLHSKGLLDEKIATNNPPTTSNQSKTELRINCLFEATPEGSFEFIIDPISGDKIKGNGKGNLKIEYSSLSDLMMYGTYSILHGNYNFSLQQVIHKDFVIREGSQINFNGNPMGATLDVDATYYLSANIEDLDEALTIETVRRSVPVNCILSLNGNLQSPTITFDIEFPNSTEELQRQVKSFINTDEMMMKQIIYLLVLSKFYTPDYSRNEYRSSEFSSVASSAISAQLSTILNSLSDKVQIGTNIRSRQDMITDTEIEMLLSSQLLDNRLIFNGNFGYKNNIQTNAFIGEFDLEYKLTPSGEFRLKTYNHANDMYRYNKSLYRQGVGVMLYKDFNTFGEIFRRRKKYIIQKPPTPTSSTSNK